MTAPGWYNAEGDPPGTQRYWDGAQWVGDAVYEPAAQAAATGVPAGPGGYAPGPAGGYGYDGVPATGPRFPSNLKTIAIIVSVLKAIPLVFLLIGAVILGGARDDFNDEFAGFDVDFDGLFGAVIVVMIILFLIGAVLLFFQFRGAIKEKPMMLFVAALIMVVIDVIAVFGSWSGWSDARNNPFEDEGSALGGAVVMTIVLAAQAWIAVKAIKTHNASN